MAVDAQGNVVLTPAGRTRPQPPMYGLHPRRGGSHASHRSSARSIHSNSWLSGTGILVISGRNMDSAVVHSFSGANFIKINNVRLRLITHVGIHPCVPCEL